MFGEGFFGIAVIGCTGSKRHVGEILMVHWGKKLVENGVLMPGGILGLIKI